MVTKKLNAVLGLLVTLLLWIHAISISISMLTMGAVGRAPAILSWALAALMLLHVFVSIEMLFSSHFAVEGPRGKAYPKLNRTMIFQRAGGMLLLVASIPHVLGALGVITSPPVVHAILPPIFFAIAMMHTAVSFSKCLISLGIGTARFIKAADIAAKVICAATLVAAIVGFYLYAV